MSPKRSIDLNADLGEARDEAGRDLERELLGLVTTAHIACGGHAGDEASMEATVADAVERAVRVGAHPSYPDREGFGRRPVDIDRTELRAALSEQLRALQRVAGAAGTQVESVKPHGALYGEVAKGGAIYETLRDAMRETCGSGTTLVLPSGCRAMAMVLRDGVEAMEEGFCDRAYGPDGALVSRGQAGALLEDPDEAAAQARSLALGAVAASDGSVLTLWVDTLCIHGDTRGAAAIASAVRAVLSAADIDIAAPARA